MREILGKAKTVCELLKGVKYSIDYYQREYKWHEKQIHELLDDLSDKFLEEYQPAHPRGKVADYPHYFLGFIIISKKESVGYIVDGQQRLTSLTLLLVLLRNLQKDHPEQVNVDELIFSERYGQKSFNLHVDERTTAMDALYEGQPFDVTDRPESVQNLVQRYHDLETYFPEELREAALPYFIDWLLENVHLVEITAYSDDDAYTIFETMNDRGLSLSPTDMLKGYLLANIDEAQRTAANARWRDRIRELNDAGKEVESDCFKAWFRSQYAIKIRERKKGAKPEDFDRIGTEFHRWLRDAAASIGLTHSSDFFRFIDRDFDFYSRHYLRLIEAAQRPVPGLEHLLYNAQQGFTLQPMLLLAPLRPDDSEQMILRKIGLVARYLDILLTWRLWNFRTIAYSTMQYAMFVVMRDIRGLCPRSPRPHAARLSRQGGRDLCQQRSPADAPAESLRAPSHPRPPHRLRGDAVRPTIALPRLRERGQDPLRGGAHLGQSPRAPHRRVRSPRRLRRPPQPHRRPAAPAQELQCQLWRPNLRRQAAALQRPEPAGALARPAVLRPQPRLPPFQGAERLAIRGP